MCIDGTAQVPRPWLSCLSTSCHGILGIGLVRSTVAPEGSEEAEALGAADTPQEPTARTRGACGLPPRPTSAHKPLASPSSLPPSSAMRWFLSAFVHALFSERD